MKSLSQIIAFSGAVLVIIVAILGFMTTGSLIRFEATNRQLTEINLEGLRLLSQFQIALNDAVIRGSNYAQSTQRGALQDARVAIAEAGQLLPRIEAVLVENDTTGFGADRHRQRIALVADAGVFLNRLEIAVEEGNDRSTTLTLQRLDLIAQDVATLTRVDTRRIEQQSQTLSEERNRLFVQGLIGTIGTSILMTIVAFTIVWLARRFLVAPIQELEQVVMAVGAGDLGLRVVAKQPFEIGHLQVGFNQMADNLQSQRQHLAERATELEAANQQQQRLIETIQALGAPILPLRDGIIVLPLVGHIDVERADDIQNRLLEEVYRLRAHAVILDLTGVILNDEVSIHRLIAIAESLTLLGAQPIFAGISSQLALQLADHHVPIDRWRTFHVLGDAIAAIKADV